MTREIEMMGNLAHAYGLLLGGILVLAFAGRHLLLEKARTKRGGWRFGGLLLPALTVVALNVTKSLWEESNFQLPHYTLMVKLCLAWASGIGIGLLTQSKLRGCIIGLGAFCFALLSEAGVEFAADMEKFAFTVGKFTLNPYRMIKAALILLVLVWLIRSIVKRLDGYLREKRYLKSGNRNLLMQTTQISLYAIVAILFLNILGLDLTTFAVFGGALGVGIGFGLQKITSNFVSGIILMFENSVEEDDLIELSDGTLGFIRRTAARYTLVETYDCREIIIPNEEFIINRVVNLTYSNRKGRLEVPVGVSYGSDIELVRSLLVEAATEYPECAKAPLPVCYLRAFGESSVDFLLYFWVDDVTQGRIAHQSAVLFAIWRKFKENGIEIPFPQRDLHLRSAEVLTVHSETHDQPANK